MSKFYLQIVFFRLRSYANFFQLDCALTLFRSVRLLTLLIQVFSVIHDPANRRRGIRSHLNQIEILFFRLRQSISKGYYPQLLPIRTDHPHFVNSDLTVDSRMFSYVSPPEFLQKNNLITHFYSYLSHFSFTMETKSWTLTEPRLLPSRCLGEIVPDSTSLSPITSM